MKHQLVLFSCLLLLCLNTSCEKAGQIHLISAHTWVVTQTSTFGFVQVGDELTFLDNRLFFINSNGIETDGNWNFLVDVSSGVGPITSSTVNGLYISSNLGSYDFDIVKLTNKELEINSFGFNSVAFKVQLEPKE
jgi:hypothetical protein